MIYSKDINEGDRIEARTNSILRYGWCYPWDGQSVPIYIEKEYDRFFLCIVEIHTHKGMHFFDAIPYKITIDKVDIDTGDIVVERFLTKRRPINGKRK